MASVADSKQTLAAIGWGLVPLKCLGLIVSLSLLCSCESGIPGLGGSSDPKPKIGKGDSVDLDFTLESPPPKRIILMIGDGMGLGAITGATYNWGAPLSMLEMESMGFMTTHEFEFISTDSAASATAMATGNKSHFQAIAVTPGTTKAEEEKSSHQLDTVIDVAQKYNWRSGLVATSGINHATPAAFAGHRFSRKSYPDIAMDMRYSGVDVMIGGGRKYFDARKDERDLLEELKDDGFAIADDREDVQREAKKNGQLIGLLHENHMPNVESGKRAMSLPEMVESAITALDFENDEGFILVVEGSQIDFEGHVMSSSGVIAETLDFDDAVAVALEYAEGRDDTLVVVTADHETGGLAILDGPTTDSNVEALAGDPDADKIATADVKPYAIGSGTTEVANTPEEADADFELGPFDTSDSRMTPVFGYLSTASRPLHSGPAWTFKGAHTPTMVPIFAHGNGSRFVSASRDNSEIGTRIKGLIEAANDESFADTSVVPAPKDDEKPKNMIIILGEGAGMSSITAGHYAGNGWAAHSLANAGLVATHASDRLVNQHGSAASAIACGYAAPHGSTAMATESNGSAVPVTTLIEIAEEMDIATGLVTDGSLTTPSLASFYASAETHDDHEAADALVNFPVGDGIDLLFGGGKEHFDSDLLSLWADYGMAIETKWKNTPGSSLGLVRLISEGPLDSAQDRAQGTSKQPSLGQMTETALETLDEMSDGFVLVVSSTGLGRAQAMGVRGPRLVDEIIDLDQAVRAAISFAEGRSDTLLVVTATVDSSLSLMDNHYPFHKGYCGVASRCDGPDTFEDIALTDAPLPHDEGLADADLQGEYSDPSIILQYDWLQHKTNRDYDVAIGGSANFVPLYASGPASRQFSGFMVQEDVGYLLSELF